MAGRVARRGRPATRTRGARLILLALAAAAATGCDRIANASPQRSLERRVARAIPAIERRTGLTFKRPPKVEMRSSEEVRAFLERAFAESRAARDLAGYEQAYKLLGLVPPALDLRKILLDLLAEQVAGFYDPKTKSLYVVKSTSPETLDLTVDHELVHALQDQYANLDSIQQAEVDNDRATAVQAAVEGHATYISLLNAAGGQGVDRVPGGWGAIAARIRDESAVAEGLGAAPAALREALIFPYVGGLPFVAATYARHPGAELLTRPPHSTEQLLHPRAYEEPRDRPTTLALPAPTGSAWSYENTLGEFDTRLFLAEHLRDTTAASAGATGWDGDRYALLRTSGGDGVVWVTLWDTPRDAEEFRSLLVRATARRYKVAPETLGATATAAGRSLEIRSGVAQGRPVVLYTDFPAANPAPPLDLSLVTLREE